MHTKLLCCEEIIIEGRGWADRQQLFNWLRFLLDPGPATAWEPLAIAL